METLIEHKAMFDPWKDTSIMVKRLKQIKNSASGFEGQDKCNAETFTSATVISKIISFMQFASHAGTYARY